MSDSTVRILFMGDSASAVRSVRTLERSFGSLGKAAHLAGAALATGIVGGLALSVKAAIDFDKQMRNVNSIAKLNETQFKRLETQVRALAKSTGQMPDTLAKGLYDIVSSGFKAADGLKILRASAVAATAGLTDTATSTKAVVAVLNAYHLSANKAGHVSDVLFQTVNKGVLSFEELASQIGDVLPVASQLGVPLTDVGGAMATITLHGVNAAEAATQLKQVLVSMLKPSADLKAEIKKMGFESGEAALKQLGLQGVMRRLTVDSKGSAKAFADWFPNVRAMNGALGITGKNIKVLHDNIVAMDHSQGATGKAFAEQGKSIAVQWQKAKAAVTAAAIPVGELLFPALKQGAEWAQKFAEGIQAHMPEIRAEFQQLAQVVQTVGGALSRGALSPAGSSALLGGLATIGTGKAIMGVKGMIADLKAGMGGLGPLGIAAAAGVGILTAALVFLSRQGNDADQAITGATNAIRNLGAASLVAGQASRNLQQAHINVATTAEQVRAAEILYDRAVRQSGRGSSVARSALLSLRQARLNHAQAVADEKQALDQNTKAQSASTKAQSDARAKVSDLTSKFNAMAGVMDNVSKNAGPLGQRLGSAGKQMKADLVQKYAAGMANIAKQAGAAAAKIPGSGSAAARAAQQLQAAAAAAAALAAELGRIPSRKEINIYIRTHGSVATGAAAGAQLGAPKKGRARGGFIPGPAPGAPVPIIAHAGEVILNRGQQEALGGPRLIASMFGFTGDEGPQFASGGFVSRGHGLKKPPRKKTKLPKLPPHHPLRGRVRSTGKLARETLKAVDDVNQREDDLDRAYGQLEREYSISIDHYGPSDGGTDVDVNVAEIDSLIGERQKMLALIEEEKAKLQLAIAALKKAIAALVAAIKKEQQAVRLEMKKLSAEKRKKKPNQKVVSTLENDISARQDRISNLKSQQSDLQGGLDDSRQNLNHGIDFDHRDVDLDIKELQARRLATLKEIATAEKEAGTETGGDTSDSGGGAGGAPAGGDSGLIHILQEELGRLRLALGLQGVQVPIIGSFAKGTLTVPETGLAMVHAGETITPANRPRGGDGGSIGDMPITLVIDGDSAQAEALRQMMHDVAIQASPAIAAVHGSSASSRRRAGLI